MAPVRTPLLGATKQRTWSIVAAFFLSRCTRLSAVCCFPRDSEIFSTTTFFLRLSSDLAALRASIRCRRTRMRSEATPEDVVYSAPSIVGGQ
jgi:hypothetical protein